MRPRYAADEAVLVSDEEPASRSWFHREIKSITLSKRESVLPISGCCYLAIWVSAAEAHYSQCTWLILFFFGHLYIPMAPTWPVSESFDLVRMSSCFNVIILIYRRSGSLPVWHVTYPPLRSKVFPDSAIQTFIDLVCTTVAALTRREQMAVWLFIILFFVPIWGRRGSQDVGPQYHAKENASVSTIIDIIHHLT